MPINNTLLNIGANAMRTAVTHASLHTATPDANGSNESSAGRKAITWTAVSGSGDFGLAADLDFTGGASSGPVAAVGLWSASVGGTFYGYAVPTGDTTFNTDGEYTVTEIDFDGSAS